MCGICGEIRFDGREADLGAVLAMRQVMAPRGPDGAGVYGHDRLAFGHRRLRVMDLSEHSHQPMFDPDLGLGIVFNGAIYNHPELRHELTQKGYRFYSHGDTEVVLKAYHAWGEAFVDRLSGMFAIALWERDSGNVLFARDRLGIKPLYYAEVPGALRFASTLPALLATEGVDTSIDPAALHQYMSFHSVVAPPRTILNGVRKLAPGTLMSVARDGSRRTRAYWELSFERDREDIERPVEDWQELVMDALRRAVKRRLVADVPVGVLLSGGLDSSLIVALLSEMKEDGLKTYSIGFTGVDAEEGDEFRYSDIIAERFDTEHHRIFIGTERLLPALQQAVAAMSEPMVSHDVVAFYLLSQRVSKDVRAVQSGQGADEVFAGYHWYPPMLDSNDPVRDYARVFFDRSHDELAQAVDPDYVSQNFSLDFVTEHFGRPGVADAADRALRLDTTVMLVDDPVKRVDNMTMAWGLEARVPFLDHEVVELAARIPAIHKIRDGGKFVLKEGARTVLPADVIDRPKGYFPVPALKYLRGPFLELVQDVLSRPAARERRLFRREYVDMLLKEPEEHITPLRGSKLWQVACLEYWLQAQGVT